MAKVKYMTLEVASRLLIKLSGGDEIEERLVTGITGGGEMVRLTPIEDHIRVEKSDCDEIYETGACGGVPRELAHKRASVLRFRHPYSEK